MADAKACDVCGVVDTDAERMVASAARGDASDYDGWWALESLTYTPGIGERRIPSFAVDVCSWNCLTRFAEMRGNSEAFGQG